MLLGLLIPLAMIGAAAATRSVPPDTLLDFVVATPAVFLGFGVLSVITPLASAGGQELYPGEQLVAYPLRPGTQYLTGLAVLPLNLAWVSQLITLTAATALLVPFTWHALPGVALVLVYIAFITTLGQLVGWVVVGLRQTRAGRRLVWSAAGLLGLSVLVATKAIGAVGLLDRAPTFALVLALDQSANGIYGPWARLLVGFLIAATLCLVVGPRACAWALRRPGDAGTFRESRTLRVRRARRSMFAELLAVDRASVWRSSSLRRGALVLALFPGLAALSVGVSWTTLSILPGLVAAGAGLLFGVNVFCLDGTGAVWMASLPHDPALVVRAKTWVTAETCVACIAIAMAAGLLGADGSPTGAQVSAMLGAVATATVSVVATCLTLSVSRPHKAELRGPRDTPAPPGAMAAYSARLAMGTTLTGLVFAGASRATSWLLPVLVALPILLLGVRRLLRIWRVWDEPVARARVVATVAAG